MSSGMSRGHDDAELRTLGLEASVNPIPIAGSESSCALADDHSLVRVLTKDATIPSSAACSQSVHESELAAHNKTIGVDSSVATCSTLLYAYAKELHIPLYMYHRY
jgi:hypothetical protein